MTREAHPAECLRTLRGSGGLTPPLNCANAGDQIRAAVEVEALPKPVAIVRMLSDYSVLRDQARAIAVRKVGMPAACSASMAECKR